MIKGKIFDYKNLNTAKQTVWQESVLPYIFKKNTNTAQRILFWIAEHTLAGVAIGMLSIGAIGVLAWETTRNIDQYPYITEVAFKKSTPQKVANEKEGQGKTYTKGSFQPIIVETDESLQPLEKITSGKLKAQN